METSYVMPPSFFVLHHTPSGNMDFPENQEIPAASPLQSTAKKKVLDASFQAYTNIMYSCNTVL